MLHDFPECWYVWYEYPILLEALSKYAGNDSLGVAIMYIKKYKKNKK